MGGGEREDGVEGKKGERGRERRQQFPNTNHENYTLVKGKR
jgi:hypothetical protein